MTASTARTIANLLLGGAAAVACYFILRNRNLRGGAFRLVRVGLTTAVPGYLLEEVRAAWKETGRHAAGDNEPVSGRARRFGWWLLGETRDVLVLTGRSMWRGFVGFYNSDNLTYAASIAYYGLL